MFLTADVKNIIYEYHDSLVTYERKQRLHMELKYNQTMQLLKIFCEGCKEHYSPLLMLCVIDIYKIEGNDIQF